MPFDIAQHALSPALLNDGAWFALEPWWARGEIRLSTDENEAAVRLRSWTCDKFQDAMDETRREHNPLGTQQDAATVRVAINHAIAKALITGLRGLQRKGEPVGGDVESLRAVLDDQRFPQFRAACIAASQSIAHFREQVEERRSGNSGPS